MRHFTTRLITSRLILRPHTIEDVEAVYQMNIDPAVSRYTGDGGVVSRAEIHRRIQEHVLGDYATYGYGRFAVELKATGEFIGFAGLKYLPDYQHTDLGYRLKSAFWGQGFATEAAHASVAFGFEQLKLAKIMALVLPENQASVRVLEKVGFSFEKMVDEEGLEAMKFVLKNSS